MVRNALSVLYTGIRLKDNGATVDAADVGIMVQGACSYACDYTLRCLSFVWSTQPPPLGLLVVHKLKFEDRGKSGFMNAPIFF